MIWLRDAAERVAWTAAEVTAGAVLVEGSGLDEWWVAPVAAGLAALKTWLARKVGNPTSAAIGS